MCGKWISELQTILDCKNDEREEQKMNIKDYQKGRNDGLAEQEG